MFKFIAKMNFMLYLHFSLVLKYLLKCSKIFRLNAENIIKRNKIKNFNTLTEIISYINESIRKILANKWRNKNGFV